MRFGNLLKPWYYQTLLFLWKRRVVLYLAFLRLTYMRWRDRKLLPPEAPWPKFPS